MSRRPGARGPYERGRGRGRGGAARAPRSWPRRRSHLPAPLAAGSP